MGDQDRWGRCKTRGGESFPKDASGPALLASRGGWSPRHGAEGPMAARAFTAPPDTQPTRPFLQRGPSQPASRTDADADGATLPCTSTGTGPSSPPPLTTLSGCSRRDCVLGRRLPGAVHAGGQRKTGEAARNSKLHLGSGFDPGVGPRGDGAWSDSGPETTAARGSEPKPGPPCCGP